MKYYEVWVRTACYKFEKYYIAGTSRDSVARYVYFYYLCDGEEIAYIYERAESGHDSFELAG